MQCFRVGSGLVADARWDRGSLDAEGFSLEHALEAMQRSPNFYRIFGSDDDCFQ
jgi:hypothetical protein